MLYCRRIILGEKAENTPFHEIPLASRTTSMDKLCEWEIETIAYVLAKWLKYSSASNFSHQRFDELADILLGKVNIQFEFIVLENVGSQNEKCKLLWNRMKVMRYQTTHTLSLTHMLYLRLMLSQNRLDGAFVCYAYNQLTKLTQCSAKDKACASVHIIHTATV